MIKSRAADSFFFSEPKHCSNGAYREAIKSVKIVNFVKVVNTVNITIGSRAYFVYSRSCVRRFAVQGGREELAETQTDGREGVGGPEFPAKMQSPKRKYGTKGATPVLQKLRNSWNTL